MKSYIVKKLTHSFGRAVQGPLLRNQLPASYSTLGDKRLTDQLRHENHELKTKIKGLSDQLKQQKRLKDKFENISEETGVMLVLGSAFAILLKLGDEQ